MKKFPLWSILELRLTVNELVKIICFEKEKLEMCRMAFRGIADFLLHRLGKYEDRQRRSGVRREPVRITCRGSASCVWAVVLNYNGLRDTEMCIHSLRESGYLSLDIVVVDNASPDGSGDALARLFPEIPVCARRNGGYGQGTMPASALPSPGSEVYTGRKQRCRRAEGIPGADGGMLERDAGIGVVNGRCFTCPSGKTLLGPREFNRWMCTGLNVGRDAAGCRSTTLECDVDYVCGVLLLVRREVLRPSGSGRELFYVF